MLGDILLKFSQPWFVSIDDFHASTELYLTVVLLQICNTKFYLEGTLLHFSEFWLADSLQRGQARGSHSAPRGVLLSEQAGRVVTRGWSGHRGAGFL